MKYDYVFFDLDGTLTDSGEGIINSFKYTFKHYGMEEPSREVLRTFIGPSLYMTFEGYFGFSHEKAVEAIAVYRTYLNEKGLYENKVYPGVMEILKYLHEQGIKIAMATSKPECQSIKVAEYFGFTEYFDKICGAELDGSRSDKADIIQYAIDSLGVKDKSKILMVGDRKFDILGAKKIGVDSCGILHGYGTREELQEAGADFIINTPEELKAIL